MGAELVIGIGKGKPPMSKSKDSPMGGDDDAAPDSKPEATDDFSAALEDAFDAVEQKDKDAFKDALSAAITAKCAEMYEGEK